MSGRIKAGWVIKPFEPGEVIEFVGDRYTVVQNFGSTGLVTDGADLYAFHWRFGGEDCIRSPQTSSDHE